MNLARSFVAALNGALGDAYRRAARPLLRGLLRTTLPKLEGATELPGLENPVEVLRDRFGVPQIFAENEHDLFFAQGYIHAQDRFFQMELGRRAGHGRLSELIGESALEFDRLSRTIGFNRIAASTENGPPEALRALEAYSAGVNACLGVEPRPPELRLLPRPEPWTPSDTAAWSLILAWSLSASWGLDLLGEPLDDEDRYNLGTSVNPGSGSNAWAVSPIRSATGSALLAGDPHLVLGIPCLWYEVGLYGGPYEVVGASLPGTPGVVIGHNDSVAWSVTAALTDVQDLYVERFSGASNLYEHAGQWREVGVREEEISVRGHRRPVVQRVRTTVHGPIISDLSGGKEDLALRWAAPEPPKLVAAGLAINRARDKEEFLDALRGWTAPNQNFVYADRTGVIGWALAGPVPVRKNHRGDRPIPGWDGRYEWEGFVPFEDLPKNFDPAEGYVASANEAPETGSSPIPGAYLPDYRKNRIEELLRADDRHTLESFRDIQGDLYCAPAHALAERLGKLDPPPGVPEGLTHELAAWDGHLVARSGPGAVARVALEVLLRRSARISPPTDSPLPTGAEVYFGNLVPELLGKLDGLTEEDLREALTEAVEILVESCGPASGSWSWGALHAVELRHPLGVVGALRGPLNRGPYPAGGDANTVRFAAFRSGSSDKSGRPSFGPVTTGPNYRFVVDTGGWERAWSVISPGQSGHPASANYDDQIPLWQNVRYRPMIFGRKTADLAARHRLVLKPGTPSQGPASL
ncbi:MAG: penicillin acylase family protein [Actinomycetota bacterium]|nr:penicillin acylase family protein [Actinomycetota bacterium]